MDHEKFTKKQIIKYLGCYPKIKNISNNDDIKNMAYEEKGILGEDGNRVVIKIKNLEMFISTLINQGTNQNQLENIFKRKYKEIYDSTKELLLTKNPNLATWKDMYIIENNNEYLLFVIIQQKQM